MTTTAGSDETTEPQGVDAERVTEWFRAHVAGVEPPLHFELIAGGRSNLTFRVDDAAGGRWVLRRPPLGEVLATAHDMSREHRIISALGPTTIPVAPAIGLCTDDAVNGAPFYVMDFVDGRVVRDYAAAEALGIDERARAGASIVDVLADIHAVDVDAVGLGDLGRREGYIERQLTRWYGQFLKSKTREVATIDEVHAALSERVPPQGPATIVHGDYRLDNCMLDADGSVLAVLDWEICTLGDPLADVGLLLVYWGDPDNPSSFLPTPTTAEGFPGRDELLARYSARSGREVTGIEYYEAFGYWKLACILEGVYARYVAGAMGAQGDTAAFEGFAMAVDHLGGLAADAVARLR